MVSTAFKGFNIRFGVRRGIGAALKKHGAAMQPAVRQAVKEEAEPAKTEFRAAGGAAGLGKLAQAWQTRIIDRGGFDYVAYVIPKGRGAIKALAAFSRRSGNTIVAPRRSKFLAIPLPSAGAVAGRPKNIGGAAFDVRRLDPQRWEVENKLRLFVWKGKKALFLAARQKDGTLTLVFLLVPRATLKPRFDWRTIAEIRKRAIGESAMRIWRQSLKKDARP